MPGIRPMLADCRLAQLGPPRRSTALAARSAGNQAPRAVQVPGPSRCPGARGDLVNGEPWSLGGTSDGRSQGMAGSGSGLVPGAPGNPRRLGTRVRQVPRNTRYRDKPGTRARPAPQATRCQGGLVPGTPRRRRDPGPKVPQDSRWRGGQGRAGVWGSSSARHPGIGVTRWLGTRAKKGPSDQGAWRPGWLGRRGTRAPGGKLDQGARCRDVRETISRVNERPRRGR